MPDSRRLPKTSITLAAAGALMALLLAACAPLPARNPLATWVPSANHDVRRPSLIVLHATEMDSVQGALDVLRSRNAGGPVSAHYLIGRDGHIYQLVADNERAWQAGAGQWQGVTDVNSASIGIELDNDGSAAYPLAQIDSLLRLLADLTTRLQIAPARVIAHADLAPARRRDPGVAFPWALLAQHGFGLWPRDADVVPPEDFNPWLALRLVGYSLKDRAATVRAFHAHYRGIDGDRLDPLDDRLLYDLQRQLAPAACPPPVLKETSHDQDDRL